MKKRIIEKDFDLAKLLQSSGVKAKQAAEIMDKSQSVLSRLYRAETWEDYLAFKKSLRAQNYERKRAVQAVPEPITTVDDFSVPVPTETQDAGTAMVTAIQGIHDEMKAIREDQATIKSAIAWIHDNVSVPASRKWFKG